MKQLNIDVIELIVSNDHLKLQNEDTLLRFLLDLYSKNRKYAELFQYIIFKKVSEEMISNFISVFEIVDLNDAIWKSNSNKLTKTGEIGTPIYMSPELITGDDHYGPSVDVYLFAMIADEFFYSCLGN